MQRYECPASLNRISGRCLGRRTERNPARALGEISRSAIAAPQPRVTDVRLYESASMRPCWAPRRVDPKGCENPSGALNRQTLSSASQRRRSHREANWHQSDPSGRTGYHGRNDLADFCRTPRSWLCHHPRIAYPSFTAVQLGRRAHLLSRPTPNGRSAFGELP